MPVKTMSPKEKTGIILILIGTATYGLFPVFVKLGTAQMPPVTLMALGTLLAAVCSFFYLAIRREFNFLKNKRAWPLIIYVTIFIVIIPYTLFSLGAARTSNLNTRNNFYSNLYPLHWRKNNRLENRWQWRNFYWGVISALSRKN